MKHKKYPPAFLVVKNEGAGAFSRLAQRMGKSYSTVYATLKKGRLRWERKFDYQEAINEIFNRDYSVDELFPIK